MVTNNPTLWFQFTNIVNWKSEGKTVPTFQYLIYYPQFTAERYWTLCGVEPATCLGLLAIFRLREDIPRLYRSLKINHQTIVSIFFNTEDWICALNVLWSIIIMNHRSRPCCLVSGRILDHKYPGYWIIRLLNRT